MKRSMLVFAAAAALLLAAGTARAFVICDSEAVEYVFKASKGELIRGTANNIPCGGSARMFGAYTRVAGGFFFSFVVDQDPDQPGCCEGYEYIGFWADGAGSGNWYDSGESPNCQDSGVFTVAGGVCSPLRTSDGLSVFLPGVK